LISILELFGIDVHDLGPADIVQDGSY